MSESVRSLEEAAKKAGREADSQPSAQVGSLAVESVDAWELPRDLLAQKKGLDPDRLYAAAAAGWPVHAFLVHEQGQPLPVACWFLAGSPLYEGLIVDTFVVDRPLRTEARVAACMQLAARVCAALCRQRGLSRFAWSTDRPERMMRLLGDPRVRPIETTLVLEIEGGK